MPFKYNFSETDINDICDLYKNYIENSVLLISKKYNVSSDVIKRILKENKIDKKIKNEISNARNNKNLQNYDYFNVIDNEEKAYWLGFLYADGWVNYGNRRQRIGIELNEIDIEHLKKFCKIFNKENSISKRFRITNMSKNGSYMCSIEISNKYLTESLIDKGIDIKKTYNENIRLFNNIPTKLYNHVIRGIFDGDGTLSFDKKRKQMYFSIINKNENVIKKYSEILCNNININNNIKILEKKPFSVFYVKWGGNINVKKIYEWMYKDATVYLDRKYEKFQRCFNELGL